MTFLSQKSFFFIIIFCFTSVESQKCLTEVILDCHFAIYGLALNLLILPFFSFLRSHLIHSKKQKQDLFLATMY